MVMYIRSLFLFIVLWHFIVWWVHIYLLVALCMDIWVISSFWLLCFFVCFVLVFLKKQLQKNQQERKGWCEMFSNLTVVLECVQICPSPWSRNRLPQIQSKLKTWMITFKSYLICRNVSNVPARTSIPNLVTGASRKEVIQNWTSMESLKVALMEPGTVC